LKFPQATNGLALFPQGPSKKIPIKIIHIFQAENIRKLYFDSCPILYKKKEGEMC